MRYARVHNRRHNRDTQAMTYKHWVPVLGAVLLWVLAIAPTDAHGYIVRSIPEDRSRLASAPPRLQYWFSEGLERQFSELNLRNQEGDVIATGGVDEQDDTLLTLRLPADLPDGAYIVELRPAFASDGHVIIDSSVFFVGDAVLDLEAETYENNARPLEIIWKALLFNATYLLFGTAMLYVYVFVPVWGNPKYPAGLLPPRIMYTLNMMMIGAIIAALFANVVALFQQTMVFFGLDLAQVIEGNLWNVVRIGTRFGDVWHFRTIALVLVAVLHGLGMYYAHRHPRAVRSFWTANTWLIALLIGGQAVNSHAAGGLVLVWVGVMVHWLHTLAVAFWVGGIIALAIVLPVALAPYTGDQRWQALRPMMMRFSRYVVGAVVIVITSGIYSASTWFFTPSDLATDYGAALGYKVLMVGLLLGVGGLHHLALRPHLLDRYPLRGLVGRVQSFGVSMRVAALLTMLALVLAAQLSATPIPEPEFLQVDIETPRSTQTVDGWQVQMTITPGGTGVNTTDIVLSRDERPIDLAQVAVQFVAPTRADRSQWVDAEYNRDGLYVVANDSIDATGRWWTLVDITDDTGERTRAAFAWDIEANANVIVSLPPSLLTLVAAFAVLGAVLFVIAPAWRRFARRMRWSALNIVISLGVIVITIGAIYGGYVYIERQEAAIQLRENPPPQQVNPTLPTQASLDAGAIHYAQACNAWDGHRDYDDLINQLRFLRDEDLYRIIGQGWRDLPACADTLTSDERWHVVNYVRTLRVSASTGARDE